MRLLITGGTGFVGAATVRKAIESGHEVTVMVRDPNNINRIADIKNLIQILVADLRNENEIEDVLRSNKPEIVIHTAWAGVANSARNDTQQIYNNLAPTCQLLEKSIQYGIRKFIGIGSQGEYGPLNKIVMETDVAEPTTLYGVSKLATAMICKQLAANANVDFAWLRLFSTYGPGDNEIWMIPSIIGQLLRGERPKTTQGNQMWDYLYIDDVAEGILAVAGSSAANGIFNLGSGQPVQIRWILETIREMINPSADIGFGEVPLRPDQVMHMEADVSRLRLLAKWEPKVKIYDGLQRTVNWYRDLTT